MAKGHEGWIAIVPETKGWGSSTFTEGYYLHADSEQLSVGKGFTERADKITYGRVLKPSNRVNGPQKPGGPITFQFRSNDVVPVMMAHYQMHVGTFVGGTTGGTSRYTFTPVKSEPDWVGSTFGSGTYGAAAGDMFTVGVIKKFFDTSEYSGTNSMWFSSCIVDSLEFALSAEDDAKITAGFKAYDVDAGTALGAAFNPSNATFGSYSTTNAFLAWTGTLTVGGESLDLSAINITSTNNVEDRSVLGQKNPSKYPLGRHTISGNIELDMPKDGVKWLGSQLNDSSFAIVGTLYNSAHDYVTFNLPTCKYDAFDLNLNGGASETTFSIPFVAYESEDGATSPITWVVESVGWGTTFNRV